MWLLLQVNTNKFIEKTEKILGQYILPSLAFTYLVFHIWNYFYTPLSPDELWFFGHTEQIYGRMLMGKYVFLEQNNYLGYGSLYWYLQTLGVLINHTFNIQPQFTYVPIRMMAFVVTMGIPLSLYSPALFSRISARDRNWAQLLFYVMPMNWWMGKISGPENFSSVFGFLGLGLVLSQFRFGLYIGALIIGIGFGIKMTAVTFILFTVVLFVWDKKIGEVAKFLLMTGVGFILANIFLLVVPSTYFFTKPDPVVHNLYQLWRVFFAYTWEWDLVFSGGLVHWSFPFVVILMFLYLAVRFADRKVIVAAALSFISILLLLVSNDRFLGWYWFSALLLIPVVFLNVDLKTNMNKIILLIGVIVSVPFSIQFITKNVLLELKDHQVIFSEGLKQEVRECLSKRAPFKRIIDFAGTRTLFPIAKVEADFDKNLKSGYYASFWMSEPKQYEEDLQAGNVAVLIGEASFDVHAKLDFIDKILNKKIIPKEECAITGNQIRVLIF